MFPSNADTSTVLQGFAEITAGSYGCILLDGTGVVRRDTIVCADAIGVDIYGTTAEVSECVIEGTSGFGVASSGTDSRVRDTEISMTAGTGVLVGYSGYAEVEGCRIEGGTVGVYCSEARASVTGCTITDQFSGGIQIQSTALAYPSEISDNILASEDETSSGISIYTPYLEVNVSGNTIDGWGTGILISSADPTTFGVVGNVVVNAAVIGIECSGQYAIGVDCNDAYNNGPTGEENYDEDCAIYVKNFEEDPLFCGGRDPSLEEYTLRIDSPCTGGYSGCAGGIGARGVECAWGELVTSTTVTEGTEVLVVGDLTVPESTVLTLEQGSSLVMNDEDLDEDGTDEDLVEFVVNGSLVATGTAQDPVTIQGEVSGPSSWWGIRTGSSGSVGLENVGLEDYYLFLIQTADTCYVVDCDLRNWDAWGLVLGLGGGSMHALVQGNEFRSHEGTTALLLDSSTDGVQVTENYFYGDEPAAYGIHVFQNTSSPLISGNYFTDYSGNEAIHINSGSPDLVNNTFEECEVGILVSGGTPRIGLGSSSDNVIDGNDVGIWVTGGVPVLRNNQITSNYGYGVLVSEGADPDLGVQNDPGLNTLTGNYVCIKNNNPGGSPTVRARGNYLGVCDSHGYLYDPCWEGNVDVEDLECDPLASWSPEISVVTPGLRILGAQPNPMASGCGIYFDLAGVTGVVTSAVYDVAGRLVRALPEMAVEPGRHWIGWDGLDDGGRRTGSGMYFVKVSANGTYSGTAKVLVAN